jgi:hypothetical protein
MALREFGLVAGLALAGCESATVDLDNGKLGSPYEAPDSEDTDDTVGDTDANVDSGTDSGTDTASDTAEPCDTADSGEAFEELITTSVAECQARLSSTSLIDNDEFVARDNRVEPILSPSGEVRDLFDSALNPDHPEADFRSLFACAEFRPVDGSPMQTLGSTVTRSLDTPEVNVELNAMALETGSLVLWIGTQNADGSMRGYTTPDASNTNTARTYTVFWDGAQYVVTR